MGFLVETKKLDSRRISPRFHSYFFCFFPFSRSKNFTLFLSVPKKKKTMAGKKNMQNKKKLKKINKLNSLLKQVIETAQKINSVELSLKRLLKPIHLSTSEDPLIKEIASTIAGIRQDQFNYFIQNKMELERMEMNAENAYHATDHNSYLDIIKEIKNVITNANLAYDATQLPVQLPEPTEIGYPNFLTHCFYLKHGINNETVQFIRKVFPPNETKSPKIPFP